MFAILLACALLLGLLPACRQNGPSGPSPAPETEWTAAQLSEIAFQLSGFDPSDEFEHLYIDLDRERLAVYIENAYGIEGWEDAAVSRATGASAFEIAVVRMEDDGAAVRAATAFMNYISDRQGDFTGYAPAEADMVANGEILQDGVYAALLICPNPGGASAAVETALSGGTLQAPGAENSREPITDVKELRDLLVADRGMDGAELEKLDDSDPETLKSYMEDTYGLTADQWEECAIARGTGDSVFEVAVVRVLDDWERISAVEGAFNDYLNAREAQFDSAAEQAKLLHRAIAVEAGEYVVLLACEDAEQTAGIFANASGAMGYGYSSRYRFPDTDSQYPNRCAFNPPNEDDMSIYDTSAIRAAWGKGDPSGLSDYDRDIYDAAKKVLDKVLKDGMSDYEKEAAVYGWIVGNVDYDWTHQDAMRETPRESFTPYGGLVNQVAVCLGYATSFQLLMDLAGVECITVVGAAHMSSSDHGWNMVRLNGQWYCVDVTWDANYREQGGRGRPSDWDYFNVTSDEMAESDHQWDYANTPEAAAQDRGRG